MGDFVGCEEDVFCCEEGRGEEVAEGVVFAGEGEYGGVGVAWGVLVGVGTGVGGGGGLRRRDLRESWAIVTLRSDC